MLEKNQKIELNIESLSNDGSGIGRYEGMAVFVPDTCPGDTVTAHIVKAKKNYAFGKVENIILPSEMREESDCPVSKVCGGCSFRHIKYSAEAKEKLGFVNAAFERIAKSELRAKEIIFAENTAAYRNKAQYPVTEENGKIKIGFYAKRSHRVIENPDCRLQPAEFAKITEFIRFFMEKNRISAYDEQSGKGLIRHIYLRKGFATGEIMLCLVINGESLPRAKSFARLITGQFPEIKAIELNINKKDTNVVLGDRFITLFGSGYIEDVLLGKRFRISPASFYQVNHRQTERLYSKVKEYAALKAGETLIDLYCGIGTIGICCAEKGGKLIGVEIVPQAVKNAKINAELNGMDNAEFICASGSDATKILKDKGVTADCVIVDPPRKGCDEVTINNISAFNPERIVYVSCNPASLARDLIEFEKIGYRAIEATAVDLFPRTTHVESVVKLIRTI